ncbi:hypothetical protein SD80_025135 [Scytonema tolypothrichoides VB-61278]|nr:hypothetical protein SD80_025135 [Scytonema tolypothrichoides VB-61278]
MKIFHICTIANNLKQYEEMKASFLKAGFNEEKCRYSLFDNSEGNIYEPYETFNKIQSNTVEPYIIFCHQDVILNQGHGFNQLLTVLQELEKLNPNWAITGNAGINKNYQAVVKITDPNNTPNWSGNFPQQVHSLDENFLVIKTSANILCSKELKGFHFYGIDLCLNAILKGYSCYVINFHLTHLSGGNLSKIFWDSQAIFYKKWCCEFNFCYVKTMTNVTMCLSKYKMLQFIGSRNRVMHWFVSHKRVHTLVNPRLQ